MSTGHTEAQLVGDSIVVSVYGGKNPRIWRADLSSMKSAAFDIVESKGSFTLKMQNGGAGEDIAVFDNADAATSAMKSIRKAMVGPGQLNKTAAFAMILALVVFAIGSVGYKYALNAKQMEMLAQQRMMQKPASAATAVTTSTTPGAAAAPAGKPVDASTLFGK